jgi:hypothetical protein
MLSKFDDYPIHQTPEPILHVATASRNAYDRYWFNGYADDGGWYFGIGAAVYPNLGIMDCGLSLVIDGEQHAFHASRRAPREPSDLTVGPFRIEILEPMMSLRVTLDDNRTGISGELLWLPRTANIEEGRQTHGRGKGLMDATRFNQFGRWQGELRYAGKRLRLDPRSNYGTKDRSWGIRPVGEGDPAGAPPQVAPQFFFLWAPLHWPDKCTHMCLFEDAWGKPWHFDGMICPVYEDSRQIPGVEDPGTELLAGAEHRLVYVPGTRRAGSAELTLMRKNGERMEIHMEPTLAFRMKGIGYSHPEWGHGRWKGELAIAGESWPLAGLNEMAMENQHIQQVMRVRSGKQTGIGVLEQIALGPHVRYGFKEMLDPAR